MHCCQESVSGLVSIAFIYKSSLKMVALLSNCSVVDQRDVIFFSGQKELKHLKLNKRMSPFADGIRLVNHYTIHV